MNIFRLRTLSIFYRELATMINSNMDVIAAMDILSVHSSGPRLKNIAIGIKQYLSKGNTLNESLTKFPDIFPEWQVNIVKYSEAGGKLAEGLNRIADYLEKDYDIQKNIIVGSAYPVILLHAAIFLLPLAALVTGCVTCYISQVLKAIVPLYAFLFLAVMSKKLLRFPAVKELYDIFIMHIPFFSSLLKQLALTGFMRALKCLYDSGVNIIQSWKIAAEVCDNNTIRNSLLKGLPVIERGGGLSEAFTATGIFSGKMTGMITAGEKSGSIDTMLEKMALYSEKQTELVIGVLVKAIPVFIYLGVSAYIGVRIISFYSGYFSRMFSY